MVIAHRVNLFDATLAINDKDHYDRNIYYRLNTVSCV